MADKRAAKTTNKAGAKRPPHSAKKAAPLPEFEAKSSVPPPPLQAAPQEEAATAAASTQTPPQHDTSKTSQPYVVKDPTEFGRNMAFVVATVQRVIGEFLARRAEKGPSDPDPLNIGSAFSALFQQFAAEPARLVDAQFKLWSAYVELVHHAGARARGENVEPVITPAPSDKRFRNPEWQDNLVFDFIKQFYLIAADWMQKTVTSVEGLDPKTQQRVSFYTKQIADAVSPTNFALTNPEVLREIADSNGENLVRGLTNLIGDIERGHGGFVIRQTTDNFVVGRDVASTPGKVVFRNSLIELIQYTPTTEKTYEIPLLVFPPWINKFYILDLQPKNSFVRWAVAQGYTVFVVSWVNPTAKLSDYGFEDYMRQGIFAALDAVENATGQSEANVIGYCIAGTLMSATMAYIAASGEYEGRIRSATFFAAQTDFSEAGDLQVFVDDEQLASMERKMREAGGVLEGSRMAMTFNLLRANELIWSFVVSNYLLGREPAPFDLLYWNSDATRMPLAMHMFYLRECYRDNALARGEMRLGGLKLDLSKVKTPLFLQAAKDDHIAPAASVYKGSKLFGGPVTFMLAGSGHIAGVVNHPDANKYQHWINDQLPDDFATWLEGAKEYPGSWWTEWEKWLASRSGDMIPAPQPGDGGLRVLCDAPGTYVLVKANSK